MASTAGVGRLLRMAAFDEAIDLLDQGNRTNGLGKKSSTSLRRACTATSTLASAVMSAIARSGRAALLRAPGRTRTCRATRCPPRARQSGVLQAVRGLRLPTWRSRPRIPSVRAPRRGSRGSRIVFDDEDATLPCGDGVAPVTPEESSLTSAAMLPFFGLPSVDGPYCCSRQL